MSANKKTSPTGTNSSGGGVPPEQLVFDRHSPEMVQQLEQGLREYFLQRHPNFGTIDRENVNGAEHLMWLFEQWDPIELQKLFLAHVGRVASTVSNDTNRREK